MGLAWNGVETSVRGVFECKGEQSCKWHFPLCNGRSWQRGGGGDVPPLGPTCPAICLKSPAVRTYKRSFERPRNLTPPPFFSVKENVNRTARC